MVQTESMLPRVDGLGSRHLRDLRGRVRRYQHRVWRAGGYFISRTRGPRIDRGHRICRDDGWDGVGCSRCGRRVFSLRTDLANQDLGVRCWRGQVD